MVDTQSYPEREKYTWKAHYLDGTVLHQEGHKVKDIRQDMLHSIHIIGGECPIVLLWRDGLKFIHFYRVKICYDAQQEYRVRLYCFGYQDGNKKTILVFMPGGIVITDDVDNIQVTK